MKEKIYKLILTLMVGLSLSSGPIAQNELRKLLETFSVTEQVQEFDEKESEEMNTILNDQKHFGFGRGHWENGKKHWWINVSSYFYVFKSLYTQDICRDLACTSAFYFETRLWEKAARTIGAQRWLI